MVGLIGHPVHQRVQCVRHGGQRRQGVCRRNPAGRLRHRHRHRSGQTSARRVHRGPGVGGHAELVRRERAVSHHPVLRHEGQPLPARPRHLPGDAGQGRRQELPQWGIESQRLSPQADLRRRHSQLGDAELPADPVHVLRARRGRRGGGDVPCRHRAPLHLQARLSAGGRGSDPPLRCVRGQHHLRAGRRGRGANGVRRPCRVREGRCDAPAMSTSSSCRTPTPARRSSTWPSAGSAPTATRRSYSPTAPPRSAARCRSTPTAG